MIREDVVDYLRANLRQFSPDALRARLRGEGVPDADIEDSLSAALRPLAPAPTAPKTKAPEARPPAASSRRVPATKLLLIVVSVLVAGAVLLALSQKSSTPAADKAAPAPAESGESGFVGARGWVVRLPRDYVGVSQFKDAAKTVEVVHFCKRGTDATNFLDEGLFGQLGIVRLIVAPSEFPPNPTGAASLAQAVERKTTAHGEKFTIKNIQIATLPGVQVDVQAPFPRVEAYVLGQNDIYFFLGGQEDQVWRDIVLSLRDARSEN